MARQKGNKLDEKFFLVIRPLLVYPGKEDNDPICLMMTLSVNRMATREAVWRMDMQHHMHVYLFGSCLNTWVAESRREKGGTSGRDRIKKIE